MRQWQRRATESICQRSFERFKARTQAFPQPRHWKRCANRIKAARSTRARLRRPFTNGPAEKKRQSDDASQDVAGDGNHPEAVMKAGLTFIRLLERLGIMQAWRHCHPSSRLLSKVFKPEYCHAAQSSPADSCHGLFSRILCHSRREGRYSPKTRRGYVSGGGDGEERPDSGECG